MADNEFINSLKKENSELRKKILKQQTDMKEMTEDMQFLMKVCRTAAKEICSLLNIEPDDEKIEEYVDELCNIVCEEEAAEAEMIEGQIDDKTNNVETSTVQSK